MEYFDSLEKVNIESPTAVAIGKFVGVHLGHQKLMRALNEAKAGLGEDAKTCVFILSGMTTTIIEHEKKLRKLERLGIDIVVECEFTEEIKKVSAEDFLDDILLGKLNAKAIVAGPDLSFGYMGAGDATFLRDKEKEKNFRLVIIDKEKYKGEDISSTRIKKCLKEGDCLDAEAMLGNLDK